MEYISNYMTTLREFRKEIDSVLLIFTKTDKF